MEGKKVLLVDTDPQGSLTISMGWQQPDELPTTLSTLMQKAMNDQPIQPGEGILHHAEGVDLIPANIELAGLEVALVNSMNREKMLKQVLDSAKRECDFILLDCMPSLGMLTVNALAAADTTLIPVQAQYLSAKGLEQLLQTIQKVRRQINPKLKIEGILMTMTDSRTNYGREIDALIRQVYGSKIRVFEQPIPHSVRAAEISAEGRSKNGKSFGFRKGRCAQDACEYLFTALSRRHISPKWVLEGDIKGCFDHISHDWLLANIPMDKSILKQLFLKAGFIYQRELFPTEEGTPQGGIISPILANMTLDGIEKKLVERFHTNALGKVDLRFKNAHKVNFVRYADDFVVTAATPELALEAKKLIREFLVKRGLELSDEKTVVTNIDDGFDFLRLLTASRMIWNSTKL